MKNSTYPPYDIELLDSMTAIRRRPTMYVGPLDQPATVNALLAESLCIALDNAANGCTTEIDITLHENGGATVRDNGPGLSVYSASGEPTAIENLLTQLYACRDAKRTKINESLCGIGIVVTNALSETLTFETVYEGWLWQQQYIRGHASQAIAKQRLCSEQWQQISFRPDPELFGANRLSKDYFSQWFAQQPFNLGKAKVTLHYRNVSTRLSAAK